MAFILRTIVAGPRIQHQEAGLDLCYVSKKDPIIIVMSIPGHTFPRSAYRNPMDEVVTFLNSKHGDKWSVWEFCAEGTGYPDSEFSDRIFHAPFPDHHPPPFHLVPSVLASMRNHLKGEGKNGEVAVLHCKAGKGRSGTMTSSYLISEEGYTAEEARKLFTKARMRPGWGEGVSIPSQVRWLDYVERWTREFDKVYIDRKVRIRAVHIWGLRPGVRIALEGYVNDGREIKTFHVFTKKERRIMGESSDSETMDVILEPSEPLIVPNSDVGIDLEQRSKARYGLAMITSVGHFWFNPYFEGGCEAESGVFEVSWSAMDGIKGTYKKGLQAVDRIHVVWSILHEGERLVKEPVEGQEIPQGQRVEPRPRKSKDLKLLEDSESDILNDGVNMGSGHAEVKNARA